MIRIKNNDTETHTWAGQELEAGEVYTLQATDHASFVSSTSFFADVGSGKALVGDADSFFSNAIEGWEYLEHEKEDEVTIVSLPEPEPFAKPTYRTKRNAISSVTTVAVNSSVSIDFKLTAQRYISGGSMIAKNAELGDYITAEVRDIDGVIPDGYRDSLCESWPVVATYIEKEFVAVSGTTITKHNVDTYPLNAKITAGLYLRLTYNAINAGSDRSVAINYYLAKKL